MQIQTDKTYRHSQVGPWGVILVGSSAFLLAIAWSARNEPVAVLICALIAAVILVAAASFQYLIVADEGDHLALRFGPLPLARKTIRYDDMQDVEVGRTLLLDGWGIHMSIRSGCVWNIWGRDCVVIHDRRTVIRVGTDDAAKLTAFLKSKIRTD